MTSPCVLPSSLGQGRGLKLPLTRIELHVHLDGAARPETLLELLRAKNLPVPGDGSLGQFREAVQVGRPVDLARFLSGFRHFAPAFAGDPAAIERIAHEFCQDEADNGVAYVEARFSPHLMTASPSSGIGCDAEEVVRAVARGFQRGEQDFGVKARPILCCIRGRPDSEWRETLKLCDSLRAGGGGGGGGGDVGVVGIDVAGDEGAAFDGADGIVLAPVEREVFSRARDLGIRRTAHAGEAGPAGSVAQALDELHAERVGHGYHSVDDPDVYRRVLRERVHLEACPSSSLLTGAVGLADAMSGHGHPVVRFARDGANFSVSTDDPTVTGTRLEDEYRLVRSWGLTEAHLVRANFNALRSCFLPEGEKAALRRDLLKAYGIEEEEEG